jgi:hypothetical protein
VGSDIVRKIIDDFSVGKYRTLILDGELPNTHFSFAKIDGVIYNVTIPYDIKNSIAVQSDKTLIGKSVEFV